jgi:hypothetical protein
MRGLLASTQLAARLTCSRRPARPRRLRKKIESGFEEENKKPVPPAHVRLAQGFAREPLPDVPRARCRQRQAPVTDRE